MMPATSSKKPSGLPALSFVPTLVFGAIIGALCSNVCILLDIFPPEYRMVMIVIGMTAFLSASARTPITAVIFTVSTIVSPLFFFITLICGTSK